MKFTHLKGQHLSIPSNILFNIQNKDLPINQLFEFYFTEDNKYSFDDADQFDWNKILGFKGEFFQPMFETVMVGWRYNKAENCFEIIPYFHLGGAEHHFDETKIVKLKTNEKGFCVINIVRENVTCTIYTNNNAQLQTDERVFSKKYNRFWRVGAWFGGQKCSPRKMVLNVDFK
jgi:hypothetical protein